MTWTTSIFVAILESFMHLMLFDSIAGRNKNLKKGMYFLQVILLSVLISLCSFFLYLRVTNIIGLIVSVFLVACISSRKVWLNLLLSIASVTAMGIMEILTLNSITSFAHISVEQACTDFRYVLLGCVLSKGLTLMLYTMIAAKKETWRMRRKPAYWLLFALIIIVYILALYLIFTQQFIHNTEALTPLIMVVSFGFLFNLAFIFLLLDRMAKYAQEEENRKLTEQREKMQKQYLDEIVLAQNETRKIRHDMMNHVTAIEAYIQHGQTEEGIRYIQNIRGRLVRICGDVATGNLVLDTLLNSKKALAEQNGIRFTVQATIPKNIEIDPMDLCMIFGNAIDNAIEACQKVSDHPYVTIKLAFRNRDLCCEIKNSMVVTDEPNGRTSKQDKKNHGYGLEILQQTLEKYNHMFNIHKENGIYTLNFFLTCSDSKKPIDE